MMRTGFLVVFAASIAVTGGCTPSSVKGVMLAPTPVVANVNYMTFDQVVPYLDVDVDDLPMDQLARIALLGGTEADSLFAMLTLHEYEPIIYLEVWLYNRGENPITVSPDMAALVDASKLQFRRLEPHLAANLYLAQVRGMPAYQAPYQPKTAFRVEAYNYGAYSGVTVTQYEYLSAGESIGNSLASLGHSIGSIIRQRQNEKLANAAAIIYAEGLVPNTVVQPDAAIRFGVFWLNRVDMRYPFELRLMDSAIRIGFRE